MDEQTTSLGAARYQALARLYHAYFAGLLLFVATRKSAKAAGQVTFEVFRGQHHAKFLSSFEKLGLSGKPDAVACAQYHYLSNTVGGVGVEYMYESDKKAWVHFCHPRWMYHGVGLCGMPMDVSHGFLNGWYGQNGVSLGNPRLGFVCTSQDMDGQYGMAGYFLEHDHDLTPDERLRFSPGELAPPFDPDQAPKLDVGDWPPERLQKAQRNYAMEFVSLGLKALSDLFGPMEAAYLGGGAARLIGQQFYQETQVVLGHQGQDAAAFATYMEHMIGGHDDRAEIELDGDTTIVRQYGWRFMRDVANPSSAIFDAWTALWQGALSVHNRFLVMEVLRRQDYGDDCFEWRIRPRGDRA